jgi:hypothetical protein
MVRVRFMSVSNPKWMIQYTDREYSCGGLKQTLTNETDWRESVTAAKQG